MRMILFFSTNLVLTILAGNHRFPSPLSGQCMEPALLSLDPCDPSLTPDRMLFFKNTFTLQSVYFLYFVIFQEIKIQ